MTESGRRYHNHHHHHYHHHHHHHHHHNHHHHRHRLRHRLTTTVRQPPPPPLPPRCRTQVVSRFTSSIASDGRFYTDSNGREFMQRIRSNSTEGGEAERPPKGRRELEPVAANFYPVAQAIFLRDEQAQVRARPRISTLFSTLFPSSHARMIRRVCMSWRNSTAPRQTRAIYLNFTLFSNFHFVCVPIACGC